MRPGAQDCSIHHCTTTCLPPMATSHLSWAPYVYMYIAVLSSKFTADEYRCACILCEEVPATLTSCSNNCFRLYSDHNSFWGVPSPDLSPISLQPRINFNFSMRSQTVHHMPRPVTASAVSLLQRPLPTQASESQLLSMPTVPVVCAATTSRLLSLSGLILRIST